MERVIFFFFHVVCLSVENEKSNKKSSSRFFSFVVLGLGFEKSKKGLLFLPLFVLFLKKHTLSLSVVVVVSRGGCEKTHHFLLSCDVFLSFLLRSRWCVVFVLMR